SNGYRKEVRAGKAHWIIDFRFRDREGRTERCRRDARVQTAAGAKAEAERLKLYAAFHGTLEPPVVAPTLAEFWTGQFTQLVLPRFRPATVERYQRLFEGDLQEALGRVRLDAIGSPESRALQVRVIERGSDPRPQLALLRTVLREAFELEVIAKAPRLPALPPKPKKLPAAPPLEVVQRLLDASRGWLRVAIALAVFGSQRNGEVRALRVLDVDFGGTVVNVRKAFSYDAIVTPKSGDERAVPLAEPLRAILAEAVKGKQPSDRLVADAKGRTPSRQRVYRAFIALQEKLGIVPTWSFHSLRHGFGTHAARQGASIEAIREMMGHADLTSTARYLHATGSDKRRAIELLAGNWGETPDGDLSRT
ncbi:MAG TPA: tyrosine-type recombinase/integrase, partial [Polyangiaceae bacterium]|nr:tyrosine-type recombinase/integrase [Polyangiaceae bacterium]